MSAIGSLVGGYRTGRVVGRGATATVFEATREGDGRRVALKVLDERLCGNTAHVERFRRAALLQQGLRHPSILEVYEVGAADEQPFVAMRLTEDTLAALVAAGALSADRVLGLLSQVAEALEFAASAGTPHGDVKPRNVLVDGDHAYLTDFSRGSPGTLAYAAPERLRGEGPSAGADVYGLACVLVECLTGEVPYPQEREAAVIGAHLYTEPPRPSRLRPGIPTGLDDVVVRALDKDPARRPAGARELIAEARAAMGPSALPALPRRPRASPQRSPRLDDTLVDPAPSLPPIPEVDVEPPASLSWPLVAAGLILLAAAVAVGAWLGQRPPGRAARDAGNHTIRVAVPTSWAAVRPPPVHGLALERALAFAPRLRRPGRTTLVAGLERGGAPAFVPPAALRTANAVHRRRLVQLAAGVAYRYVRAVPGVPVLYVLPGPVRSVAIACVAPRAAAAGLRDCEGVARTVAVSHGATYDPRPSRSFGAAVNSALRVLRPARRNGLRELAKAPTRRAEVRWANATAVAYRTTAASLRKLNPPAIVLVPTQTLVRAVDRAGVGYTRLSDAARVGDAARYDAARRVVVSSEARLRGALRQLRALGYGG